MKIRKMLVGLMAIAIVALVVPQASVTVKAATVNTVFNGDFEITSDGNDSGIEGWGNFSGARDLVEVVSDAHSGNTALKVAQFETEIFIAQFDAWVKAQLPATYDPTRDAEATVWAKYEGITGEGLMFVVERKYDNGANNAFVQNEPYTYVGDSKGWVELKLDLPAIGDVEMSEVGIGLKVLAGEGVVIMDDFSITQEAAPAPELPGVFNGDFEITSDGNDSGIEGWGNFTGARDLVEVVSDAHSGNVALKIAQFETEIYIAQFDSWVKDRVKAYDPTKDAVLSAWVKYEGLTGEGLMLLVERKHNGGADNAYIQSEPYTYVGSSDGWVKIELPVPAMGATETNEVGVGIKVLAGEGVVYIDDISFEPATDAAAVTDTPAATDTPAVTDTAATDSPKTGDNFGMAIFAAFMCVISAAMFITINKKVARQ